MLTVSTVVACSVAYACTGPAICLIAYYKHRVFAAVDECLRSNIESLRLEEQKFFNDHIVPVTNKHWVTGSSRDGHDLAKGTDKCPRCTAHLGDKNFIEIKSGIESLGRLRTQNKDSHRSSKFYIDDNLNDFGVMVVLSVFFWPFFVFAFVATELWKWTTGLLDSIVSSRAESIVASKIARRSKSVETDDDDDDDHDKRGSYR
jgi:hypothetical protein